MNFAWPIGEDFEMDCRCGRRVTLHWNGGELDADTCRCGRRYEGEFISVEVKASEPPRP